jgi:hypothetical protein
LLLLPLVVLLLLLLLAAAALAQLLAAAAIAVLTLVARPSMALSWSCRDQPRAAVGISRYWGLLLLLLGHRGSSAVNTTKEKRFAC